MSAAAIIERARQAGVKLALENGELTARGPEGEIEQLLPDLRRHKLQLLSLLCAPSLDPTEASGHWLVIEAPKRSERWFTPPATRAELQARHPAAVLIALPDTAACSEQSKSLSPQQQEELARLIPVVARDYGCHGEELTEIKAAAERDPEGALRSFRAMVTEEQVNGSAGKGDPRRNQEESTK